MSIMNRVNEVIERTGSTSPMIRVLRAPERDLERGMPNEERNRQRNVNYNRRISVSNQCFIIGPLAPLNLPLMHALGLVAFLLFLRYPPSTLVMSLFLLLDC